MKQLREAKLVSNQTYEGKQAMGPTTQYLSHFKATWIEHNT